MPVDWQDWVLRWDRMQERYLVARPERFQIIAELVVETQKDVGTIIDLGCGTGSLSSVLVESCPSASVVGLDVDSTLLELAQARTSHVADRVSFVQADLRERDWMNRIPRPIDAVVSATALHWLNEKHLSALYVRIAEVLRPGGLFLNADHVSSESALIQEAWETHRMNMLKTGVVSKESDDWDTFWRNYLEALGPEAAAARTSALGEWEGTEEGFSLTWHLDRLRQSGFSAVDCFWRSGCDAIYGGLKA